MHHYKWKQKTFRIDWRTSFVSIGLQYVMERCKTDQTAIRHDGNIVYASNITSSFLKAVFCKFYSDLS